HPRTSAPPPSVLPVTQTPLTIDDVGRPTVSPLVPSTTLFRSKPASYARVEGKVHPFFFSRKRSTYAMARLQGMAFLPFKMLLSRSEEHTSELQSRENLVCRLLLEKKKQTRIPA